VRVLRGLIGTHAGVLVAAGAATIVAGCGGSGTPKPSGEAAKSPETILRDASAALSRARSFRATGKVRLAGQDGTISLAFQEPSSLSFSVMGPSGGSAKVILAAGTVYLNADKAYFAQQGAGAQAAKLGGQWIKLPSGVPGLTSLLDEFKLSSLGRCLAVGHGTLSRGGDATVDGQSAIVVVDAGDKPGSTPGKTYVATSGPAYPLRLQSTGGTRSGGVTDKACKSTSGLREAGTDVTLSGFDDNLHIAAPAGAKTLQQAILGG
jgi:hypothetical protein